MESIDRAETQEPAAAVERPENPALSFTNYRICIHLALPTAVVHDRRHKGDVSKEEKQTESFERDMLAYAYRDVRRPFRTRFVGRVGTVTTVFPSSLFFESEGKRYELKCKDTTSDRGRGRELDVTVSHTDFEESQTSVLHLVFHPSDGRWSELNEYDVIKLMKLWEGGEVTSFPVFFAADDGPIGPKYVELNEESTLSDDEIERRVLEALTGLVNWVLERDDVELLAVGARDAQRLTYRVATVELLDPPGGDTVFKSVASLTGDGPKGFSLEEGSDEWRHVVAAGGIVQGLLDFEEIGKEELSDVFEPAEIDKWRSFRTFHKGTLVQIKTTTERDLGWPTVVNPYLAIPHAVILHNEERTRAALAEVEDMDPADAGVLEARDRLGTMRTTLGHHVPNVFHYRSERDVFKRGHGSRGIDELRDEAKHALEFNENRVEYVSKVRGAFAGLFTLGSGVAMTIVGYWIGRAEVLSGVHAAIVATALVLLFGAVSYLSYLTFTPRAASLRWSKLPLARRLVTRRPRSDDD